MDYRVSFKSLDKELLRVSPWRGGADVLLVWLGVFFVAGVLGHWAEFSLLGVGLMLMGILVIGIFQHGLAALGHHAVHVNLHPDKRTNDRLFRWLIAAPTGQSFLALRREHLLHHATFGTAKDPERYYYDLSLGRRDRAGRFVVWSILMFLGYVVTRQLYRLRSGEPQSVEPQGDVASMRTTPTPPLTLEVLPILLTQSVLFVLLWMTAGSWWGYPLLWALPLVTVGGGLNGMRATLEHADPSRPPNLNRSFVSNPLERWALGPYNFSHHYEHHRFMMVPYYRVRALRQLLQEAGDYEECSLESSYTRRYLDIVKTLRQQSNQPVSLVDAG